MIPLLKNNNNKKQALTQIVQKTIGLYQTCHFFPGCWRRLWCISFGAICWPTISLRPSSLRTVHIIVRRQLFWTSRTAFLVVLMKAGFPFWPYSICQLHSIRWTTAFFLHACMTCVAYLARLLNGFHRICLIDSNLSASTVGSLHKRSFITGFVKVLSWAQYSLLCTHSHCLTSFLKESASQICWRHSTSQIIRSIWLSFTDSRHRAVCRFCWEVDDWQQTEQNNDKPEALVVGSRRRVSVSQDSYLRVGSHDISFKGHVKSLGVYTDATLSMAKHVDHISRSAYLEIRRISSVRHLLTRKATVQLMRSFVLSRLDYCNSLLIDITSDQTYRLKENQNYAAKVVFRKANMGMLHHF